MCRLAGKVAIVTGAAQGIGLGIARVFVAEGAAVVLADIQDDEGHAAAAALSSAGGHAGYVHTDVTAKMTCAGL